MTKFEIVESIMTNLGRGFISIVLIIAFIFIMGTIISQIQKKSINVFDDIDKIWVNGSLAILVLVMFFLGIGILWGIGFIVVGGYISL